MFPNWQNGKGHLITHDIENPFHENIEKTININPTEIKPGITLTPVQPHVVVEESLSLTEKEKEFIQKALTKHKGRRKHAAKELGISERTLYRKMNEYGLH